MVCDAMDTAEEVAVCDEEATAKLAACKKESSEEAAADEAAAEEAAACWAPWASEPLSKGQQEADKAGRWIAHKECYWML